MAQNVTADNGTIELHECKDCGAVFATKDELNSHMIEIHKVPAG